MTQILITGSKGQLGRALCRAAAARNLEHDGADIDTLDITAPETVSHWIGEHQPQILVNCAAYTAVDDCEENEEEATRANGTAVAHLAAACNRYGVHLIHVSTDYVFDGTQHRPYLESDPTCPLGAYGRSKLAGEIECRKAESHLIVRTAWLYGLGGRNFVEAIRRQVAAGSDRLRVVADQHGCPTFCDDLAWAILELYPRGVTGTIHAVNTGETSWHGFASEIVRRLGSTIPVDPVPTEAFPRPAPRPAYSVLDTSRLATFLGKPMPDWKDALGRYLEASCAG